MMPEKKTARMLGCTLNGVDDSIEPEALVVLAERFPFAEFGLAWDEIEKGAGPYATEEYIAQLAALPALEGRLALHVCGFDAIENLLCNRPSFVTEIAPSFRRVQINLTSYNQQRDLEYLINVCGRLCDGDRLNPGQESKTAAIIVPYNAETAALAHDMGKVPHLFPLYDGSAGKGVTPLEWPIAMAGCTCGYAGGLKPENIKAELRRIHAAASQASGYWIDMESGVREGGQFSLKKAEVVLAIVKEFLDTQAVARSMALTKSRSLTA